MYEAPVLNRQAAQNKYKAIVDEILILNLSHSLPPKYPPIEQPNP
jgi:hypothetical protein